jgi:uncharacterized protein (TIGR03118 family)
MKRFDTKSLCALAVTLGVAFACDPSFGTNRRNDGDDHKPDHPSDPDDKDDDKDDDEDDDEAQEESAYSVENLVSDQQGVAETVDPNLVNPWGLAFGPDTFFWVANAGTSTSTLYDGEGNIQSDAIGGPLAIPRVTDPMMDEGEAPGPTGLVFYGGEGFEVEPGAPSRFIFATTEGTLVGWSPESSDPRAAIVMVDNSMHGAVYTGLAIAESGGNTMIYAANFAMGTVDVYDESFAPATAFGPDAFVDSQLPEGYRPFGIQTLDGLIYVAYALANEEGEEQAGAGLGIVSVFTPDGSCVARMASGGLLDAPWGFALAPESFGEFGGALLVGNFGDGRITAFDPESYEQLGQLEDENGMPIAIDGLWAIAFGNDRLAGDSDDLYFTAGPDEEMHGLFGEIEVEDADEACEDDDDHDDDDDDHDTDDHDTD